MFSIVSQCLGFDWPHEIDCQVWTSLGHRGVEVRKLSCYLGLGYSILRKVPHEVVGAILKFAFVTTQMFGYLSFAFASSLVILRV